MNTLLPQDVITTERRADNWMAHITGDTARWAAAHTEAEAIGQLWRTWASAIIEKCRQGAAPETEVSDAN